MDSRPHASIGEVLGELQMEFPDITISKIRFLESQGLIQPERTTSGYRKFYDADVARLRWILEQQQEHFLPLKVIKERLADMDARGVIPGAAPESVPASRSRRATKSATPTRAPRRRKSKANMPELPLDDGVADDLGPFATEAGFDRRALAEAAGLTDAAIADLEAYGLLITAGEVGGEPRYDDEALAIATSAAGLFARGIEARHLRMYRIFAGRELALFQQVIQPILRIRNPESRAAAQEEITELARLGRALRAAYLRAAVADLLDE